MTFQNPNPANDPFREEVQKIRILLDTIKGYGECHHKDSMTGVVIKYLRLAVLQMMACNFRRTMPVHGNSMTHRGLTLTWVEEGNYFTVTTTNCEWHPGKPVTLTFRDAFYDEYDPDGNRAELTIESSEPDMYGAVDPLRNAFMQAVGAYEQFGGFSFKDKW